MVKRICPICGEKHFTAAEQSKVNCSCGYPLGPEDNQRIGEPDAKDCVDIVSGIKTPYLFPVVGKVLETGHKVIANYKNQFILAEKETSDGMEYVTYYLDQDGKPYSGSYRNDAENAERNFVELCFRWFGDWYEDKSIKVIIPETESGAASSGVLINVERMIEDAKQKYALVKRNGIIVEGQSYWHEALIPYIGCEVKTKTEEEEIKVYSFDGLPICSFSSST